MVSDAETLAREILAAVWTRVCPAVKGITRTEWGKRNKRFALDMAHAGVSVEQVLAAQTAASKQFGEHVYSLRIVQDHIVADGKTLSKNGNANRSVDRLGSLD